MKDLLEEALLTPIALKAIAVTALTYLFIYLIMRFNLGSFFIAFTSIFLAVIVMQEIQSGTKNMEHSAKELGGLAFVISLIVWFTGISLVSFTFVPIIQTLVITFISIILYLYIFHPTKMDKEYVERLEERAR